MEVLCKSGYQDIYRITDGVLLVINKFKPMKIDGINYPHVWNTNKSNSRIYTNGCQKHLKRLTQEYKHEQSPKWSVPIGTVIYGNTPVEIAPKNEWEYQIKTTGELFSGNQESILRLLNEIKKIIELNGVRTLTQYHNDSDNLWQYFGDHNCGCGSNVCHLEYDVRDKIIYGVCNACGSQVYTYKDEYVDEKLKEGVWK